MNLPKSHKEAITNGAKHYFTGKPCSRGHSDKRFTTSRGCVSCSHIHNHLRVPKRREWRRKNRDRQLEVQRQYYDRNRERICAVGKKFRAAHIELSRERGRLLRWRRRARLAMASGKITKRDIESLLIRQRRRCYWCEKPFGSRTPHLDHVWPISKGGSNGPENVVFACSHCNHVKQAKTPIEYAGRLL